MKFNKAPLALFAALVLGSTAAHAANGGSGKINFEGSIIDAPCSLDAKSQDQTVTLDQVSSNVLANSGESAMQKFNISLRQCDIERLKKVKITFGGDPDKVDSTLLGIAGSASGAGIVLTNGSGEQVKLGEPSTARELLQGDNTLVFGAYLRGSIADQQVITPGEFTATANFLLAYE